nr:E3 ubiquitin-protein ligase RNF183 isoform X1 [Kogia breviceps]
MQMRHAHNCLETRPGEVRAQSTCCRAVLGKGAGGGGGGAEGAGHLLPDLPVSGLRMAEKQGREPECPVCWNPFNNTFHTPKVLDCCHSFCVECLAHLSLVTPARRRLLCPLCRQPTVLASGQPVTDLPTDTAVLTLLRLEPHHVILEGRQLCLKDEPKGRYFLRQPRVYTLELGPGPGSQTGHPQDVAPTTSPSPSADSLRGCFRNPQFRTFAYLLAVILSAALLLIFSIFWTKQFFGGVGPRKSPEDLCSKNLLGSLAVKGKQDATGLYG